MHNTLEQQSQQHNNDYTALEALYRASTGSELIIDPYQSASHPVPNLTHTASVVIPAWNACETLEQCLISIEQSSFNRKYQQQLEVVVVDDGSTDGTWELLQQLRLNVRLKAVRQAHHSRAHTQNTGIAVAEGDVIISCDADMILAPFAIEEMVKRHQVLERVMVIGFRGDVEREDARIQPGMLREQLPRFLPPFERDVRLNYGAGWPESMCRDTQHLKFFREGRLLMMPDGSRWSLANMVFGALFSLARRDFVAMDGYDERFFGWGCEDTLVGVRAMALDDYIIPVYAAAGLHISHKDRSARKWQEFAANRRVFQAILRAPFVPDGGQGLACARSRVREQFEHEACGRVEMCACLYDAFTQALTDAHRRGKYLYSLGRYDEAAAAFAEVRGATIEEDTWALFDRGKALRAAGHIECAVGLLEEVAARLPESPWPSIELALALAAQGQFAAARMQVERARSIDPANPWVNFILRGRHLARADVHLQQGDAAHAVRDCEAALILEPHSIPAQLERVKAFSASGNAEAARKALLACAEKMDRKDLRYRAACIELAEMHLARDVYGAAKVVLEEARRLHAQDREVKILMNKIHLAAARAHPLPLAREIARSVQAIPGWFSEEEAELLIALVLKTVARRGRDDPPVLVEIGSYCGRATVAMGLAVRGLGYSDARIVSVDGPDIGPAPGGRSPREVLGEQLAAFRLSDMVIYAPEEDSEPWQRKSDLLLVDGRHDYAGVREDVERYAPRLAAGGYLLFHDYADYFPDVPRYVNELLTDPAFEFVAHVGTLIAFTRRAASPAPREDEKVRVKWRGQEALPTAPIWMYWEGPMPTYIALCCKTVFTHNEDVVLLNRASFEDLFVDDRDIEIDALPIHHRSDFIRAYLLKHYGGLYLDADCVVMHSLAPILEMVKQSDFVGYREQQGNISNNLMASTAGGKVITTLYNDICSILRSGGQLDWCYLGSIPLEKVITRNPGRYVLLPTETIMPVNWSRDEEFGIRRSDADHERYAREDAFCYMLSNNTIKGRAETQALMTMSETDILSADFFISFLFRRTLIPPLPAS